MSGKKKIFVLWITGLSSSGKTTLARSFFKRYKELNPNLIFLDGDDLRSIMFPNKEGQLHYSRNERLELALKYSALCKLLFSQGISVVISTISMFEEVYNWNRNNLDNYIEIFLDIPLDILRARDPKNIYKKFDRKLIKNVAGLDLLVDIPKSSDLVVDVVAQQNLNELEKKIYNLLPEE